jgi:hypothetical protein
MSRIYLFQGKDYRDYTLILESLRLPGRELRVTVLVRRVEAGRLGRRDIVLWNRCILEFVSCFVGAAYVL